MSISFTTKLFGCVMLEKLSARIGENGKSAYK